MKNTIVTKLALVFDLMAIIMLFIVPFNSAEFYVLIFTIILMTIVVIASVIINRWKDKK